MVLMVVIGYGITMDVEDLSYAVFDRDQSSISLDYRNALSGSRYFDEKPAITSYADMDKRMKSGEISLPSLSETSCCSSWNTHRSRAGKPTY